ncbi:MAG: hypothetical protein E7523_12910 [Ruminococcaceae bacterium]|nr:hypothetical protein [Oscillospiraceae bacterium]
MKKLLFALLALVMVFAFAACSNEGKTTEDSGLDLSVDPVEVPTNKIDFEVQTPDLNSQQNETNGEGAGNKIDFAVDTPDLNFDDIEIYDDVPENKIDFELEPFEFDFDIEPVEVSQIFIDFEPEAFKLENIDNFADADIAKIDDLTEDELALIVTTKATLLHNLKIAFQQVGLSVEIDEVSGEIALDSTVLFGGDSAALTEDGMKFLQKFITVYSTVVFNEEFDGFVSKILVEGHTAPVAGETYESSLPLSVERAENVKAFCTAAENGLSAEKISALQTMLEPIGYSNTKPVLDAAGNVDMAASRRVAFRFLINLD